MADESNLDNLIARLRTFDEIGVAIATSALADVLDAARATASSGTTPEGAAWAPTKDGRRALPNAANAITAVVSGTTKAVITLILKAPYVFHQRSKNRSVKKGLPRREILPISDIPAAISDAIQVSARRVVGRQVRAR